MRAVIQRVDKASVHIHRRLKSSIGPGLMVLLGIEDIDTIEDIEWVCSKIISMRLFQDKNGKMNLSLRDVNGELLVVSQFTLHASTKKGNRPSFIKAARPVLAKALYNQFIELIEKKLSKEVKCGEFGAMMDVEILNSGPVTIIIDSKNKE